MLRGSASLSESNTVRSGRTQRCTVCQTQSTLTLRPALRGPDCWSLWTLKSPKNESCASPFCAGRALKHCHDVWPTSSTFNNPTGLPQWIIMIVIYHGSLNVPIEHHPTIRYMVYNGYFFRWCPIFPKWDRQTNPCISSLYQVLPQYTSCVQSSPLSLRQHSNNVPPSGWSPRWHQLARCYPVLLGDFLVICSSPCSKLYLSWDTLYPLVI